MTILTYIALIGLLFALALGIATILGESGYRFDFAAGFRARRRNGRAGGRRAEDGLLRARS